MRRLIALVALALIGAPASALAAPEVPPPPAEPQRPGHMHASCVTIAGNPQLEESSSELPPPTDPEGHPVAPPVRPCPSGQALTQVPTGRLLHHNHKEPFEGGNSENGYFYVSQGWPSKATTYEAWFSTEFSDPVIPENTAAGAHSVIQEWLANTNCNGSEAHTLCTIELGWEKEETDQREGYKGAKPFCFYTASDYLKKEGEEIQTGECPVELTVPEAEDIFVHHYVASDGSPESGCGPNLEIKPCHFKVQFLAKQYKGAWWIWSNLVNAGKGAWIGHVSDGVWGHVVNGKLTKPFVALNHVEDGGEVFDFPNNPQNMPMGNGNQGTCTCATNMSAVSVKRKLTPKEGGGEETENKFFTNMLSTWPQLYLAGNFGVGNTEAHVGG